MTALKDFSQTLPSKIWSGVHQMRRIYYRYFSQEVFDPLVPVISVGNLSFGGTGKTPITQYIAKYLESKGMKVCILTRGYKGKLERSYGLIQAGEKYIADSSLYGDEPLVLARNLKKADIIVGKRRGANYRYYYPSHGPDVILLDDGYQHLKIARNLNILLFDATTSLDKLKPFPAGNLRESISASIDADFVLLTKCNLADKNAADAIEKKIRPNIGPNIPIKRVHYQATGVYNGQFKLTYELSSMSGKRVLAVAALANPKSFIALLKQHKMEVVGEYILPDHASFGPKRVQEILLAAIQKSAMIICTEKDMVKIQSMVNREDIFFLGMKVVIEGEDELKQSIGRIFHRPQASL